MFKRLLFLLSLVVLLPVAALAQSGVITGTVTDAKTKETMPAVNVRVAELTRGDATDINGKYTIAGLPAGTYTVVATFTGFKEFRTTVQVGTGIVTVDIALEEDILGLEELVVTGYGTVQKREVTGSVAKVSAKDFADVPVQNTESILQGRAAGVVVNTNSGNPGGSFSVLVRGAGSINASSQPLYIVDGVQISFANQSTQESQSPLNALDPQNIESIEVLKDAASAAIYGANGANGVVIITTKRGSNTAGRTNISLRSEWGYRAETRRFSLLESPEWLEVHIEAATNQFGAGGEGVVRNSILAGIFGLDPTLPLDQFPNTDWQDLAYREGFSQEYNATVNGGDADTQYFISGGWEETEGHILDSRFERFNLITNLDQRFSSKLKGSVSINLASTEQNGICQDGAFINCPVTASSFEPPVSTPFLPDGSFNPNTNFGLNNNLEVQKQFVRRRTNNTQILGNLSATYDFLPWLSVTTRWGIDWRDVRDNQFRAPIASTLGGQVFGGDRQTSNWSTNTVLSARKTFNEKHNVSGIAGFEYRRERSDVFTAFGVGLPNALLSVINATSTPNSVTGFNSEFRQAGYFGRVNYDFDGKYILSFTGRYDGSSRFGSEERWGFFPSFSGAWRISEESFFNASFVDELKLRAGYGTSGNSSIGNFAARGLAGVSGSYNGLTGLGFTQLGNNALTWEEAKEFNLGVDATFLKGRISTSVDVYTRDNEDLLLSRPLPAESGFTSITENTGTVRNEGIEFQLNTTNVDRGGFIWTTNFNIAVQKNEIKELNDNQDALGSGNQPFSVGRSRLAWWVPRWGGVNPADGRAMWLDQNGNLTYNPTLDDRVFVDGGEEDVVGGFGNTFSYKGVTLDVFFQYSFGATVFLNQEFFFLRTPIFFGGLDAAILRRWQQPGDITDIPRQFTTTTSVAGGANFRTTLATNALQDASYIRLKNITLSYNLPRSISDKLNLRGIRLYGSGLNLMTWTAYTGLDPEQSSQSFPTALQVNGGIEIRF